MRGSCSAFSLPQNTAGPEHNGGPRLVLLVGPVSALEDGGQPEGEKVRPPSYLSNIPTFNILMNSPKEIWYYTLESQNMFTKEKRRFLDS